MPTSRFEINKMARILERDALDLHNEACGCEEEDARFMRVRSTIMKCTALIVQAILSLKEEKADAGGN